MISITDKFLILKQKFNQGLIGLWSKKTKREANMNLLIVESPAKAKTIEKYLGKDYKVLASFGHVRDLPSKELAIDVDVDFEPTYEIPAKAKKVIADIKKLEKEAKILYLATDLDREGEAISWHVLKALKLKENDPKVKRITFSEITKTALEKAVSSPRDIDMNLVDAQQARRVLDRLVGYKLSPLLWKKVKSGLSAGRVQSVAVRLIAEREREILAFNPVEYWVLGAVLNKISDKKNFSAYLKKYDNKDIPKLGISVAKQAEEIAKNLTSAKYSVLSLEKKDSVRKPPSPFTTSTLQMEASRKLGFSAKQTMSLAQKLYEAGHITYMRTDSTNFSVDAIKAIRETIKKDYGDKYLPETENVFQTKTKRAQEAHEGIRPSHFENINASDDPREQRLYELIWKRSVASQMKDALFEICVALIEAKSKVSSVLEARGEVLRFDGFMKLYMEGRDDEESNFAEASLDQREEKNSLPPLKQGDKLNFNNLIKDQKFTEPPKRYSEATLVKKLESLGIGRPSTYAPTLSTIQDRGYVLYLEKRFSPTEIGLIVNDLLVEHFADVVDYQFTAKMEDDLDEVATGDRKWVPVIREFYEPFIKNLKEKDKSLVKDEIMKPEMLKEKCPECGEFLMIRHGRFGKFIACSGYPKCKYSRPLEEKGGEVANDKGKLESVKKAETQKCEKCGKKMILKEGRFGQFLACEDYPKCKNTKTIVKSSGIKCPECNKGEVVEKRTKKGRIFWGCSNYPDCKYASWTDPAKAEQNQEAESENKEEDKESL